MSLLLSRSSPLDIFIAHQWRLRMGPTSAAFRESGWCADVPAFHCARNRKHGEVRHVRDDYEATQKLTAKD